MEKLKALIDDKYANRAEFAKAIGVDPSVLSRMLANGNWKADRIAAAVKVLDIKPEDIPTYFFTSTVANKATRGSE